MRRSADVAVLDAYSLPSARALNVLGCGWLIWWTARSRPSEVAKGEVIDHVWDGDLQERNNPMPRWWLILFLLTIVFCFVYFVLYPALGRFGGVLGWSKQGQYEQEMARRQGAVRAHLRGIRRPGCGRAGQGSQGAGARPQPVPQQLHQLPRLGCARRYRLSESDRQRLAVRR